MTPIVAAETAVYELGSSQISLFNGEMVGVINIISPHVRARLLKRWPLVEEIYSQLKVCPVCGDIKSILPAPSAQENAARILL